MSDSGTDSFVGVVAVVVIVVALVSATRGAPPTASGSPAGGRTTRVAPSPRPAAPVEPAASTNIPGGALLSCSGTLMGNETVDSGGQTLNLKVYNSRGEGGRTCAVAAKIGDTTRHRGQIATTLRFADATTTAWPQYAEHRSTPTATRSGAIYLDRTDGRCVRADARFVPSRGGQPVTVTSAPAGCG